MKKPTKMTLVITVTGLLLIVVFLSALFWSKQKAENMISDDKPELDRYTPEEVETATFSLGCFWGPDAKFGSLDGVIRTRVGYAGGSKENPTYRDLGDHTETIQIDFDPDKITYEELLDVFWNNHRPTFHGSTQYRSLIFYHPGQKDAAEASKQEEQGKYMDSITTEIRPFSEFYRAEDYHQKYHLRQKKSVSNAYQLIYSKTKDFVDSTAVARANGYVSGHGIIDSKDDLDGMGLSEEGKEELYDIWKRASNEGTGNYCDLPSDDDLASFVKPSDKELKEMLTPLQYKVTQEKGTEPAFNNKYWDNKEDGIYVDLVSREVLFSSTDKFKSGSGWPSFSKPLEPDNIVTQKESGIFDGRTEVRSKHADSHLGHLFNDGPEPTGKRYCMNSAALRFVPKDQMDEEGYGEYLHLFD